MAIRSRLADRAGRLLLIVFGVFSVALMTPGSAAAEQDAPVVFCLTPGRQESLVKAAVALRLAEPAKTPDRLAVAGQEWDITKWRDQRNDDFSRACEALFSVEQVARQSPAASPGPSLLATLTPFIVAIGTAILAVLTATWRDKISRGKVQADALFAAVGEFLISSDRYISGWLGTGSRPDDTAIREHRAKLLEKLGPITAQHSCWKAVAYVRDQLRTGPFGPELTTGWVQLDTDSRAVRVDGLNCGLATLDHTIVQVARGLLRPFRSFFVHPAVPAVMTS
ncbi:hypothetical protein JOF56_006667 [Kibdelosporangium banguiense]|uniref:Uncharacterized protein n=1 Tax=Kibdelosporangium banguiense TaxID=1365924 RepID=A0ABS4TPF1_9PSEU|nr:hypothetical protein [Kibdelosporangium banguiense]MBP2326282.1 hypothetical protein [Kibdelosporangium banguiense]